MPATQNCIHVTLTASGVTLSFQVREQLFIIGRVGGGREKWGVGFYWDQQGGVIFFYASIANIFNKCYKKAVFMINNSIWYI